MGIRKAARRVIILGAAGRDFHNFNVFFRSNPRYRVVAFTATQIPNIEGRRYPARLAGRQYPAGIPIYPESELTNLMKRMRIDIAVFSYSDVSHEYVMHKASEALAAGADFWLLGPASTMLKSRKPVIAICAVRTGAGKSQTTRYVSGILQKLGVRSSVIRHPMPYGNLQNQAVQSFRSLEDLERHHCTIEEREEYEHHLANGSAVFAGVDYEKILREAEKSADVILWDGGNNDVPFIRPDLHIVVADPFRVGHELTYHPGETNLRMADIVVINKVNTAPRRNVLLLKQNIRAVNPHAKIVEAESVITVDQPSLIRGKRVLVIEDGPTLTHGEMRFGAGYLAAKQYGARRIVDPKPYAVGSIRRAYEQYPHVGSILPALGYGKKQMVELERTINRVPCDTVIVGTPIDIAKFLAIKHPTVRVTYELKERGRTLTFALQSLTRIHQNGHSQSRHFNNDARYRSPRS
jgi:predicted GTPase